MTFSARGAWRVAYGARTVRPSPRKICPWFTAFCLFCLPAAFCAPAHGCADPEAPKLSPVAVRTLLSVKQTGASGNGDVDDTAAIQKALDAAPCEVQIPPGTYKISGALKVHSQTRIKADAAAVIRLADHAGTDFDSFMLCNADPEKGNCGIVVEGGIWDGNSRENPRGKQFQTHSYAGVALNFCNVRNLAIRKLTIRNPESFSIRLGEVEDFAIEDIVFDQSLVRPNQDGVHVGGCSQRGIIRNLKVSSPSGTNDDMVALNADDDIHRNFNLGMKCGAIRNVRVENLNAADAYTFVRLLSYENPIENVLIDGISGGFRTNALNMDRWRFPPGGGKIRNVSLRNCRVHKTKNSNDPYITVQSVVQELRIEGFQRQATNDEKAPTLVLDNGKATRLEIVGLTQRQRDDLLRRTPQLPRSLLVDRPDHGTGGRVDLGSATVTGKIILGEGGVEAMTLSVEPP